MHLTRPPQLSLRPFIDLLWATDGRPAPGHGQFAREHVLPTGGMHLVFRMESAPLRLFDSPEDVRGRVLGHAVVGGARSIYYIRDVSAPSVSVGALLRPGAAVALFGVNADELAHRHSSLDDLWGPAAEFACERLFEATNPATRLQVLEAILSERLAVPDHPDPAIAHAIERFHQCESVATVTRGIGCSHRHFVSRFRREVGLAPKAYSRLMRFQNALRQARNTPATSWAEIALAAGYSDQAHFNREFRALAGMTPGIYLRIAPVSANHVPLPR